MLGGSGGANTKQLAMKWVDDDELPDYAIARAVWHDGHVHPCSSVTAGAARGFKAAACVASHRANEVVFDGEPAPRFAAATTRAS